MSQKIYVGDAGTILSIDTGVNLTGAQLLQAEIEKPDGTTVTITGTQNSVDNTHMDVVVPNGVFSIPGTYKVQAVCVLGTWSGRGSTAKLVVFSDFT